MHPCTWETTSVPGSIVAHPLSRGQAALWFLHTANPASVSYNLAGAVAIPGDANLEALQRAFQRLGARHPMLRMLFCARHGEPVQHVYPSTEVAFWCEDASGWSAGQLDDHLAEEIYRPFDLQRGPTWRVTVYRHVPASVEAHDQGVRREHLVLMTLHHIICDLWSMALIFSDVLALYDQEAAGTPVPLKPLRETYADHLQREAARLSEADAESSWQHWHTVLSGELPTLRLPTDRPHPPVATGRGVAQSLLLGEQLTERLRAVARQQHASLHRLLLAAFQILLYRHTGQDDILVGFPKAGRSLSTARIVGYFVNQTVVRADFADHPRFTELLHRTSASVQEGSRHDWYPFSSLVQRLQPERDMGRSPLIQAVFSWQRTPRLILGKHAGGLASGKDGCAVEAEGLAWRVVPLVDRVAPFDLTMLATETPSCLAVTIEYATDLFDAATIVRMAACYRTLLESIAADPEQRISDLALLPERERAQLLEGWNATTAPYPAQACLHQLFEGQVECTPQTLAVAGEDEQLTYSQLNRQANQLAHYLREQGVGPDRLVGVCLEPSAQMIVAILGTLKAGGAYLPLDPSLPEKRLAFVLADARPVLVCTRQGLRPLLAAFDGPVLCLDAAICIHRLQEALRETIPLAAIFEAPTASGLARYLEQNHPSGVAHLLGTSGARPRAAEKAVRPAAVVPIQRKGSRPPLFCIHPAGGVVFTYYTLVPHMGQDQPLYGIQDPDLYDSRSTVDSIEAMAAGYMEQVRTVQDKGPYHLLGWSVGGVVAYEMAQQLCRQGESVGLLVMLDTQAPAPNGAQLAQLPVADREKRRTSWIRGLTTTVEGLGPAAASIASYVRSGLFLVAASARRREIRSGSKPTIVDLMAWAGLDTWRTRLLREAHVVETVSQDATLLLVEMPAVRRILGLVREHRRLGRRYSAKRYPGRIVLFRGVRSTTNGRTPEDPTMGWGAYAERGVEVHAMQANHVALFAKPYVETVARELTACLDRHRSSVTTPTGTGLTGRGTTNAQAHRPEHIS